MRANHRVANFLFVNRAGKKFEEVGFTSGVALGEGGKARSGMGVDSADWRAHAQSGFKEGHKANAMRSHTFAALVLFWVYLLVRRHGLVLIPARYSCREKEKPTENRRNCLDNRAAWVIVADIGIWTQGRELQTRKRGTTRFRG